MILGCSFHRGHHLEASHERRQAVIVRVQFAPTEATQSIGEQLRHAEIFCARHQCVAAQSQCHLQV